MRNKTILLLLITFTLGLSPKLKGQTLNGYWSLICYSNILTGEQSCRSIKDESQTVSLEFKDNGKTGKMSGHADANIVDGEYIIRENQRIKVKNFGGTKVGGPYWKYDFWLTIGQSSSFKFNKDTLVIFYDNDTKAMKFIQLIKKKQSSSLMSRHLRKR